MTPVTTVATSTNEDTSTTDSGTVARISVPVNTRPMIAEDALKTAIARLELHSDGLKVLPGRRIPDDGTL